ncbi:MAG: hypothetical protein ACN4GW_15590 [Desulforhopalus sp.]
MQHTMRVKKITVVGGLVFLLVLFSSAFIYAQDGDTWQNEISIYGWLAGIDGDIRFPSATSPDITVQASDIVEDLNMVFMGNYVGNYNNWSFIADIIYMDVGEGVRTPLLGNPTGIDLNISSSVFTGAVGYDLVSSPTSVLALVGGVRYMSLDVDAELEYFDTQVTEISGSESLFDGIIGLKGAFMLGDNWYFPYAADIGTGSSDLTYQLFAAIGYHFSWGDIRVGYRFLGYDLGDDKVMEDLQLSGPVAGIGFIF